MRNAPHAFTVIELMIAVSIVAVLVALAVPAYLRMTCRAHQTEVANMLRTTAEAAKAYQAEHNGELLTGTSWFRVDRDGCHVLPDVTVKLFGGAGENRLGFAVRGKSHYKYRMCVAPPGTAHCDGMSYWIDAYSCQGFPVGEYWTMDATTPGVVQLTPVNFCKV